MNGIDLMNNLIDELNRARDFINEYFENHPEEKETLTENEILLDDIHNDLERYYDYSDSFNAVLSDIVIE
jgi:hypothetical protein